MTKQKIDPKPARGFLLCGSVPQQHDIIGGTHFFREIVLHVKVNDPGPPHQIRVSISELRRLDKRGNCWEISGQAEDYCERGTRRELNRKFRAQFLVNQEFGWFEYLPADEPDSNAVIRALLEHYVRGSPTMSLSAPKGARVILALLDHHGLTHDRDTALRHLTIGKTYTVDRMRVGGASSDVYLKEFPGVRFNTILFLDAPTRQ